MQLRQRLLYMLPVLLLSLAPTSSWAFKINPCLRVLVHDGYVLDQNQIRASNFCAYAPGSYRSESVHEHLTNFSIDEYRGTRPRKLFNYMGEKSWTSPPYTAEHSTSAIIFGSWWNDDPLMYSWGSGKDFRDGLFKLKRQFGEPVRTYAGGVEGCMVPAIDHLGWNSHFGKLQHLHFMTNLEKPAAGADQVRLQAEQLKHTVDESLLWIEFAYMVAIGKLKPTDPLTAKIESSLNLPSVAANYCLSDPSNAKIRTLFARAGLPIELRNARTHDVALGSIFHILQDSFSPGHTCRVDSKVNGVHMAVLTEVYNYNAQDHVWHGEQDSYPGWMITYAKSGEHVYTNDPIAVGAWLLEAVDKETPWAQVREHLLQTVFYLPKVRPAGRCIGEI